MVEDQKATRRDFISGKLLPSAPAASSISESVRPADPARSPAPERLADTTGDPYLVRVSRRAMACQFQVFFGAGQYEHGTESAIAALDCVERMEALLTIYRDDSEICRINRSAWHEPVGVDEEVFRLLQKSQWLYEETDGAFDITAGRLSEVWGFARRAARMPSPLEISEALAAVGTRHVQLDEVQRTVRFLQPGVALNFGGIGKGYALDRSSVILEGAGIGDFLFHGGRSSVIARGHFVDGRGRPQPWRVGVIDPQRPDRRLAEIVLRDVALSTSGSQTQSFHFEARRYGHILDPRTGWPADGMLSATVLAESAADADALSTALFVLGRERAVDFCRRHPEIGALLVLAGRNPGTVAVEAYGIDEDAWQLLDRCQAKPAGNFSAAKPQ